MSFPDLGSLVRDLEASGQLVRIREEVDPNLEVTVIQHRVLAQQGPALLFENVKGSRIRLVTNLYGTQARVDRVFSRPPAEIGALLASVATDLIPPSPAKVWQSRNKIFRLLQARMKNVSRAPVLAELHEPPALDRLPCLTCWPQDGGPFFTLPLVHTCHPETGVGNLGIYRMQRFDASSTGMHWQIEKGGGFHFQQACARHQPLPISVILGGPPALTLAAIAPLPEGIDERILAALILGQPLEMILRRTTGHRIPAQAEMVIEGTVTPGDCQREGPFGDHLGHYSHSADFPVFRAQRLLSRRHPLFPATVVGKPPQEDFYIGCALQEMTLPILKLMHPGVRDLWAYPETGFHPLAVASVSERYPHEALKQAFAILGQGQLSLTKILIVVNGDVPNIRDFRQVSRSLWQNLDAADGLHLIAPTAQDTLDFTGPAMNTGSRLILLATHRERPLRTEPPPPPPPPAEVHASILRLVPFGEAFLMVQVRDTADHEQVIAALRRHPATATRIFHVLVSADVDMDDPMMLLWGWFTRFDPLADLHPAERILQGNRLIFRFPICIDARWKPSYRNPVAFDPATVASVDRKWSRLGIPD
ncbi:MAG: UbiD family decarboxylase [bacterium]